MNRASLKESLKQQVLAQVEVFGEWKQNEAHATFEQIEAKALEMGQTIMRAMISYGVEDEQQLERQHRSEADPLCAQCGRPMRYGGQPAKTVKSKVGDIRMERDYYHCLGCGAGLFPPG
jgi:hypothetical protein